jgi:hypothetical protein
MMTAMHPHPHHHQWSGHFDSEDLSASDGWEPAATQPELHLASGDHSHPAGVSEGARRAPQPRAVMPRLVRSLLDVCVLGGVTMTPVLSILGWVGLMLPIDSAMHQVATALLCVAMIWLGFALVVAHTLRGEAHDECRRRDTSPSIK